MEGEGRFNGTASPTHHENFGADIGVGFLELGMYFGEFRSRAVESVGGFPCSASHDNSIVLRGTGGGIAVGKPKKEDSVWLPYNGSNVCIGVNLKTLILHEPGKVVEVLLTRRFFLDDGHGEAIEFEKFAGGEEAHEGGVFGDVGSNGPTIIEYGLKADLLELRGDSEGGGPSSDDGATELCAG